LSAAPTTARRRLAVTVALALGFALAGCGETVQTIPVAGKSKSERMETWQANNSAFLAPGWTPSDKLQWEAQLRNRAQGQNDYVGAK
jgi:hypothetical protein